MTLSLSKEPSLYTHAVCAYICVLYMHRCRSQIFWKPSWFHPHHHHWLRRQHYVIIVNWRKNHVLRTAFTFGSQNKQNAQYDSTVTSNHRSFGFSIFFHTNIIVFLLIRLKSVINASTFFFLILCVSFIRKIRLLSFWALHLD